MGLLLPVFLPLLLSTSPSSTTLPCPLAMVVFFERGPSFFRDHEGYVLSFRVNVRRTPVLCRRDHPRGAAIVSSLELSGSSLSASLLLESKGKSSCEQHNNIMHRNILKSVRQVADKQGSSQVHSISCIYLPVTSVLEFFTDVLTQNVAYN